MQSKTWKTDGKSGCSGLDEIEGSNIGECKQKCQDTPGCTAIVVVDKTRCSLRNCSLPVPEPDKDVSNKVGYYRIGMHHICPIYSISNFVVKHFYLLSFCN